MDSLIESHVTGGKALAFTQFQSSRESSVNNSLRISFAKRAFKLQSRSYVKKKDLVSS